MKKTVLLFLCILPLLCFAKDDNNYQQLFKDYTAKSYYKAEGNNLIVQKSYPLTGTKTEMIAKLKNTLSTLCTSEKSKITSNSDNNQISAVLFWEKIYTKHITFLGNLDALDAYCNVTIQIEGNKLEIICSVPKLLVRVSATSFSEEPVFGGYPFTEKLFKSATKDDQTHSIINLIDKMHQTISTLQQSVN